MKNILRRIASNIVIAALFVIEWTVSATRGREYGKGSIKAINRAAVAYDRKYG